MNNDIINGNKVIKKIIGYNFAVPANTSLRVYAQSRYPVGLLILRLSASLSPYLYIFRDRTLIRLYPDESHQSNVIDNVYGYLDEAGNSVIYNFHFILDCWIAGCILGDLGYSSTDFIAVTELVPDPEEG